MRSIFKKRIICWLTYVIVWLLYKSYRLRYINPEERERALKAHGKGVVCYACWHQFTLSCMLSVAWRRFAVMVSPSFDGEVISYINSKFGLRSARGSSSRNGKEGLREMIELVADGFEVGFTVDGPLGPLHKVKPGVITLASRTGIPILPVLARGRHNIVFAASWDQFHLPRPFTDILVMYGSPIHVPAELSATAFACYQEQLEESLHTLSRRMTEFTSR